MSVRLILASVTGVRLLPNRYFVALYCTIT